MNARIINRTKSYHESLADCIADVEGNLLELNDAKSNEWDQHIFGSVGYGETYRQNFLLDSLRGKGTRKGLLVSIYRLESGRYELTCYIN